MAEKLKFNLVSPERELFARDVDEVLVPGADGEFGVYAQHAPVMSTLLPGILIVKEDGKESRIFVRGGFADVTPEGLTVLAEQAIPVEELKGDRLSAQKKAAEEDLKTADSPEEVRVAERAVQVLSQF